MNFFLILVFVGIYLGVALISFSAAPFFAAAYSCISGFTVLKAVRL